MLSYSPLTNCMLCEDYNNGGYQDTWYLQYDPKLGIKEIRDELSSDEFFARGNLWTDEERGFVIADLLGKRSGNWSNSDEFPLV